MIRAGKAAFFVTEKFAFHQVFRNGTAVDGNKRFVGAVGQLVNRARRLLFTRTGLAGNINRNKAVGRIGDARETFVDVRIICATHKNLEALVESGAFRQDLYYRLNVVTLHMPPLREMREDLGALILYLLYKHRHGNQTYKLSPKAQEALLHYSYPGNFRELENILERAVALTVGQVIQVDDLQIQNAPQVKAERSGFSFDDIAEPDARETTLNHSPIPPFDPRTMQIQDYLDQVERSIIEQALQQTRYNRTQAAKLLGISFRSMRYRMERLDIN